MRQLDDDQLAEFDTEYVDDARWAAVRGCIDADFPDGRFRFLDVGGGNGRFADRLLAQYPQAFGTVLDNSRLLLDRNTHDQRKTLVCDTAENLAKLDEKFDVLCVHWLLHHLVGDSYAQTRRYQEATLATLKTLLTSRGRVSMFENNYTGWLLNDIPGRLIYSATAAPWLTTVTRRMGANTAGIGVCFLSKRQWYAAISNAGLSLLRYAEPDSWKWPLRWQWRVLLMLRDIRVGHYWLG